MLADVSPPYLSPPYLSPPLWVLGLSALFCVGGSPPVSAIASQTFPFWCLFVSLSLSLRLVCLLCCSVSSVALSVAVLLWSYGDSVLHARLLRLKEKENLIGLFERALHYFETVPPDETSGCKCLL